MDKKYQIFISSTYEDLQEERRAVIENILNLSHIPIGMEAFQASNETQWNYIKKRILGCDYYLVIIAERYGSIGVNGLSFTEMEYDFAIENHIPIISLLLHKDSRENWPKSKIEIDKLININKFREKCESRMCQHWKNKDDLGAKAVTSLVQTMGEYPRTGWVRGDAATSQKLAEEIAKLSSEKRELEGKIEEYTSNSTKIDEIIKLKRERLSNQKLEMNNIQLSKLISLADALFLISREISKPISIPSLKDEIERKICKKIGISNSSVHINGVLNLIDECILLGLMEECRGNLWSFDYDEDTDRWPVKITREGIEVILYHESREKMEVTPPPAPSAP